MKTITAYESFDNQIFRNESTALRHEKNLLIGFLVKKINDGVLLSPSDSNQIIESIIKNRSIILDIVSQECEKISVNDEFSHYLTPDGYEVYSDDAAKKYMYDLKAESISALVFENVVDKTNRIEVMDKLLLNNDILNYISRAKTPFKDDNVVNTNPTTMTEYAYFAEEINKKLENANMPARYTILPYVEIVNGSYELSLDNPLTLDFANKMLNEDIAKEFHRTYKNLEQENFEFICENVGFVDLNVSLLQEKYMFDDNAFDLYALSEVVSNLDILEDSEEVFKEYSKVKINADMKNEFEDIVANEAASLNDDGSEIQENQATGMKVG